MADEVFLRVPAPSLAFIGWESDAALSGSFSVTVPTPVVVIGDVQGTNLVVPTPTASFSGTTGAVTLFTNTILVPKPVFAFAGTPGVIGGFDIVVPAPRVSAGDGNGLSARAPVPTATFSGVTGAIGSLAIAVPAPIVALAANTQFSGDLTIAARPTAAFTGATGAIGGVGMVAPAAQAAFAGTTQFAGGISIAARPSASFSGVTGNIGSVSITLSRIALAAEGHTGIIGSVDIAVPMVQVALGGGQNIVGTVAIKVPMLRFVATGSTQVVGTTNGYVLNTKSQALSDYDGLAFNSLVKFNDVYLGMTDAGIFALTGATDDDVAINAVARTGITDFGTSHQKRVEYVWVEYRATGTLNLTVITDGGVRTTYKLKPTGSTGMHLHGQKIGQGLESEYWGFEVANVAGCDFALDVIEPRPLILKRRRGGGNA